MTAGSLALAAVLAGCGLAGPLNQDTTSYDVTDKVTALEVETDAGEIKVTESDRAGIRVTEHLSWQKRRPQAGHETRGETLVLTYTCTGGLMAGSCDVGYDVEIPRGLRVKALSDSGKVTLQSLSGAVETSSDSSKVTLRDLSGNIEATSDSGEIAASGLTSKQVVARTDSSVIGLAFTSRPDKVETESDSGKTVVRVPEGPYKIATTTDSGAKRIDLPHDSSAANSLTLSSDSGAIEVLPS